MTLATRLFARPCLASVVLALSAGSAGGSVFKAACAPGPNADAGNGPALVGAIEHANSHAGPDTVLLERNCTYTLTAPDNYWYGPNGLPPIASNTVRRSSGMARRRTSVCSSSALTRPIRRPATTSRPAQAN